MIDIPLYVHVPFCRHICFYCDFCHSFYKRENALRWLEAFKREFKEKAIKSAKTIYIGGGTPTALDDDILEELLIILSSVYTKGNEYTIEINPETFDENKAKLLKKYHINRASIGLISSNDEELKSLGRGHTFSDVIKTVELLKKYGIDNYSLDILYSYPGQTLDTFKKTIADALSLKPKHLSLYSLTIEENTVFYKKGIEPFNEDIEADYYEYALKTFEDHGFYQYEVSNFAQKGFESKHNLIYWHYEDFLGLSMGASSKMGHKRYDNTRSLDEYENGNYIKTVYDLSIRDEMFEMIMMSLRLKEGLSIKRFDDHFKTDIFKEYNKTLPKLLSEGSVYIEDDHLKVKDLEILNIVLIEFLD